jgi:hypothetical protein
MADTRARSLVGSLMVLGGLLLLTQTLGIFTVRSDLAWSILFIVAGLAFLALMIADRAIWWPAIPGFTLLGIGLMIALRLAMPFGSPAWAGSIFLGFLGLGFASVYLVRPSNWWAIIPAGTMLTLALVTATTSAARHGPEGGALFLIGLGITFMLVYLVPTPRGRMTWAIFPAIVLLILGVFTGAAISHAANVVWPVLLIAAGVYLVYRSSHLRHK